MLMNVQPIPTVSERINEVRALTAQIVNKEILPNENLLWARHTNTRLAPSDIEQQPAAIGEFRRVARRRQPRRRAVERGTHDIEVADLLHVERRDADALAAGLGQEALAAQQHHRLQHRLA